MTIMKGIDFKFDDFKNLNVYKSELEKWAKKGTEIAVMHAGFGTNPTATNETIAGYVKDLGMELAYYWFVYGYTGEGSFQATYFEQGTSFGNTVKSLESKGFTTPFKLAIDVEGSGYPGIPVPSGNDMYNAIKSFIDGFNSILPNREFIIYSYLDFSQTNFNKKLSELCDSEWISTSDAGNPFTDVSPMAAQKKFANGLPNALDWCDNNWCGWQYEEDVDNVPGIGQLVDVSGFNEKFYAKNKGKVVTRQTNFKNGSYVKLTDNCESFAANKIPQNDKNKPFIINSIKNSECSLNGLSELVFANELKLVEKKEKHTEIEPKRGSNSNNINASLLEKAAIMIALNEGFKKYPYDYGVGKWGHSVGYGTYIGEFNSSDYPLSKELAWKVLLKVLEENYIPTCNVAIEKYFGNKLTDCQKCAIYTFGFNLEGYVDHLVHKLSVNDSWENTFANYLIPSSLYGRRKRSWNTFVENKYNLFINNIGCLPNEEIENLARKMNGNS